MYISDLLSAKPNELVSDPIRRKDAITAYEGLVAANVRTPSGEAWENFKVRVRDAFSDPRFADMTVLGANEEVCLYAICTSLVITLCNIHVHITIACPLLIPKYCLTLKAWLLPHFMPSV